jgi:uncharacterized membrane protein YgcG
MRLNGSLRWPFVFFATRRLLETESSTPFGSCGSGGGGSSSGGGS